MSILWALPRCNGRQKTVLMPNIVRENKTGPLFLELIQYLMRGQV